MYGPLQHRASEWAPAPVLPLLNHHCCINCQTLYHAPPTMCPGAETGSELLTALGMCGGIGLVHMSWATWNLHSQDTGFTPPGTRCPG